MQRSDSFSSYGGQSIPEFTDPNAIFRVMRRMTIPLVLLLLTSIALVGFVITQVVMWKENDDVEEWLRYTSLGLSAGVVVAAVVLFAMFMKAPRKGVSDVSDASSVPSFASHLSDDV